LGTAHPHSACGFQQYVNLRPVRLFEAIESPLKKWKPGEIDFTIVRENNEGEYSSIGGRLYEGTEQEMVVQQTVFTRRGVNRVLRFAFELARNRKKHLTSATKSNGIIHTMPFWDECFRAMSPEYPDVRMDEYHIDILTAHFVRHPDSFDVVVGSNLFGTFSRIWALPSSAQSALRLRLISTLHENIRRCLSRSTVRRRISPGKESPTPSDKFGREQ
jgi:isocitrate/isopropylmalate dehydrogenase